MAGLLMDNADFPLKGRLCGAGVFGGMLLHKAKQNFWLGPLWRRIEIRLIKAGQKGKKYN
jgi:hypothetical protein